MPDFFGKLNFEPLEKKVKSNLGNGYYTTKSYQLTKDGFVFLVMGFTGKDAAAIKVAYIEAFNAMAEKIKQLEAQPVQLPHIIGEEQAAQISKAVLARCSRTGESWQKVYHGLHDYLGVDSYHNIPFSMYHTAMRYLNSIDNAPELFTPGPEPEPRESRPNFEVVNGRRVKYTLNLNIKQFNDEEEAYFIKVQAGKVTEIQSFRPSNARLEKTN